VFEGLQWNVVEYVADAYCHNFSVCAVWHTNIFHLSCGLLWDLCNPCHSSQFCSDVILEINVVISPMLNCVSNDHCQYVSRILLLRAKILFLCPYCCHILDFFIAPNMEVGWYFRKIIIVFFKQCQEWGGILQIVIEQDYGTTEHFLWTVC
jgi:hypothetical protein